MGAGMLALLDPEAAPVLQPVADIYQWATTKVVNLFGSNPWLIPLIVTLVCANNVARLVSRRAERAGGQEPQWATLVIGLTDPIVGNFWRLVEWLSAKLGLPIHGPAQSGETPLPKEPVPQASIDRAEGKS